MKILFFIRSFEIGGSQRQLVMLAAGLARRGHDVAAVVFYGGGPNQSTLANTGARIMVLDKKNRWDIVMPLWRLWRILRTERPDIVYSFLPTQTTLSALLMPIRRVTKLVFGVRATDMMAVKGDTLSALIYWLEGRLSGRADFIVANAATARADAVARGMPADRIALVPNGIDTETMRHDAAAGRELRKAWGIVDNAFVIGIVARLDPMKDHENFLTAAALFLRDNPNAWFVAVGGGAGAYRHCLEQLTASLGLGDRVRWVGAYGDVRAAYNAFDIVTLSSAYGEAFPNAVGEAMACRKLVAATDVGDVSLIIGDCGETVPPRRPDLLSAAWTRLRQRQMQDQNLGAAARERIIANYSVDRMVLRTEKLLSSLCAGRRREEIVRDLA